MTAARLRKELKPVPDASPADAAKSGGDWAEMLRALPYPAAILHYRDDQVTYAQTSGDYPAMFQRLDDPDYYSEVLEIVRSFLKSPRDRQSREAQMEGPLGTIHITSHATRLSVLEDGTERVLITVVDKTSERVTERNYRRELMSDSLTALPNRVGFGEDIEELLANSDAPARNYAILAVDLIRFSRINESLGGLAGDELIITVARRLKSSLRQGDILARIGGNEFAIFARTANGLSDALHIVQRINDALASPVRLSNLQISVDCAVGCALSTPGEEDAENVLRQAQAAVRLAKRSGKLEIYRPSVLKEAHRRFNLESRLREALNQGGLELAFQPLIELRSGDITGFEALARWNDPELGQISPSEFIPVAEESGLIVPLGRWAMYEAAQTLARWDLAHGEATPIGVNVNLSPIQMSRDEAPSVVQEALRYAGIAGKRLTVELTESAIIADPDKARQVLNAIKAMDCTIAMDDFGTGYSNLASLQSLPIDILKIDRSFVSGMMTDRDKYAIVRAILSLAESLHLRSTAEGIEHPGLASELCALGCDKGQGFYFAPPMNETAAFAYWSARWNFETI